MHLIVGATGLVGGMAARRLRARGCEVRALVRGDAARPQAAGLAASGVSLVEGELGNPASLSEACAGIDTVVCTATSMPAAAGDALQKVDHDGVLALIAEAERAGVRRFVYTSFSGNFRHDSPLVRAKRACEARLSASTMQSVVLRPSCFMQVWLGPPLGFDAARAQARIYGEGTAGISYVSAEDVAAFAVAAAMAPGALREVVEIGGPEPVSQLGAVAIFERLAGRSFTLERVPMAVLEAQHRSPDPLQQTFAALMLGCASGDAIPTARDAARRYGIALTSVEDFAASALGSSN